VEHQDVKRDSDQSRPELRLIHTGGTIGMIPSGLGLTPMPGLVESAVGSRARVFPLTPLLDSAAIGHRDWNRILDLIEAEDGPVIVTHGTDTMSYTGAALSQALAGRAAQVILCGAMDPLGTGGDAEANLDLALSATPGPGVWLAFAGRLIPAAGLVKHDSQGADSFRSVPQDPLPVPPARRFAPARIGILTITPDIPTAMVAAALGELDACVLRVFGTGTAPPDPALYAVMASARQNGCRLRAVSSSEKGGVVPGTYAAGAGLWAAGVEDGGQETAEAAFIHLWLHCSREAKCATTGIPGAQ
jgi:L-asparaginase